MEFTLFGQKASQWLESEIILTRFRSEIRRMPIDASAELLEQIDRIKKNDILIWLPYWLTNCMTKKFPLNTIRALSVGNFFATAFFLTQDKLFDGHADLPDKNAEQTPLLTNVLWYKWLREYQRVFSSDSSFWVLFEQYLAEYTRSIIWEKREHWGKLNDFKEEDFKYLGQKLSPLKMSSTAICLLDEKKQWITPLSDAIENYHMGYQLADDIRDWKIDLKNQNFTYFLTQIHKSADASFLSEEQAEQIIKSSSIVKEVIAKSEHFYSKAREISAEIGCKPLMEYLDEVLSANTVLVEEISPSPHFTQESKAFILDTSKLLQKAEIHDFHENGAQYLFEVNRRRSFRLDVTANTILSQFDTIAHTSIPDVVNALKAIPKDQIEGTIQELLELGALKVVQDSPQQVSSNREKKSTLTPKRTEVLVTLGLQVVQNDATGQQKISLSNVKAAINLMLQRSESSMEGHIFFFDVGDLNQGERDIINQGIRFGKDSAKKLKKHLAFSISCDGLSLNGDVVNFLIACEFVTITVIFKEKAVDALQHNQAVTQSLSLLIEAKKNVRVVLQNPKTHASLEATIAILDQIHIPNVLLENSEDHICDGTANIISDFVLRYQPNGECRLVNVVRTIERLKSAAPFRYFCDVGKSLIAIRADGAIFPCHKFLKAGACMMGTVSTGIEWSQGEYIKRNVDYHSECSQCWGRNVCGGGCLYHFYSENDSTPCDRWCKLYKRQIENAIVTRFSFASNGQEIQNNPKRTDIRVCDLA